MVSNDNNPETVVEDPSIIGEQSPEDSADTDKYTTFSKADIRHNMIRIIMLESIFAMGAADLAVVITPIWEFLGASNTLIGFANSLAMTGIIGTFVSPWISVRFRFKKWYLFASHLPYIGMWGIMGLVILFSKQLGMSSATRSPVSTPRSRSEQARARD